MNALANSQLEEIGKFLGGSGLANPPTVKRYTGQETSADRKEIAANPPDILLTNFMMLELMLTRGSDDDRTILKNCEGLKTLVLDELHIAMLVRRERLAPHGALQCIGTSATMASGGEETERRQAVADVARRLFGVPVTSAEVIGESLRRETSGDNSTSKQVLAEAVLAAGQPMTDDALRSHPLAAWIEMNIGLDDSGPELRRRRPMKIRDAAERLATASGTDAEAAYQALLAFLMMASRPERDRGGSGDAAFMPFKLHQFVSGAGTAYATLAPPGERLVSLEGQKLHPDSPTARLYETRFCRKCGQEHHPASIGAAARRFTRARSMTRRGRTPPTTTESPAS